MRVLQSWKVLGPEMASRIVEIAVEAMSAEQRAAYDRLISGPRGRLPTPYKIWLHQPSLAMAMEGTGTYLLHNSSLSKREIELAVLIVARHFRSEYVFNAHSREGLDAGLAEEALAAIAADRPPVLAESRECAIRDAAQALCGEGRIAQSVFDAANAALGQKGIADLLALLGYYTAVSMAMKMYDLPPPRVSDPTPGRVQA
jgi:4-carboxymuconolactone decarboxylase